MHQSDADGVGVCRVGSRRPAIPSLCLGIEKYWLMILFFVKVLKIWLIVLKGRCHIRSAVQYESDASFSSRRRPGTRWRHSACGGAWR
ncbi:hypothetical protein EMIT0111MI5_50129 [Burkholderia sp. IT-111MI5]